MSKYTEAMKSAPACLVIKYMPGETREKDNYGWGFANNVPGHAMPLTDLIGFIVRVQAELAFRNPDLCDGEQLVIAWNGKKFAWFTDSKIPVDALVGALELVKATLVSGKIATSMQEQIERQQTGLIDTNGRPILKG